MIMDEDMTMPTYAQLLKERRIGKFYFPNDLLENSYEIVKDFLGNFLMIRAEMQLYNMAIEYIALNPGFTSVPLGQEPPTYYLDFEYDRFEDENGGHVVLKAIYIKEG
jgi:hypothetical protein